MANPMECAWHENNPNHMDGDSMHCTNCGVTLNTRLCDGCGIAYLNYESSTGGSRYAPRVSSDGDLCCARCIKEVEQEIQLANGHFEHGCARENIDG